jgi:hypothetical protein
MDLRAFRAGSRDSVRRVKALQVSRVVWAAIFGSTVAFLGVLLLLKPAPSEPPQLVVLVILAGAALSSLVASFVIPPLMIRQALARSKLETKQETVADSGRGSDVLPYRQTATITRTIAADPERARRRALAVHQTRVILELGMSESVALLGFSAHFLGFPLEYALPFFAAAFVSMALRYPTLERALVSFEQAAGVHIPRA